MVERPLLLIPARGGSKRLPRKNAAIIGDLPGIGPMTLVECAIREARLSGLGDVMVSTDDSEISQIAGHWRCNLHWRSPALRGDDVPTIDIVRAVTEDRSEPEFPNHPGLWPGFDAIILLQPTSPLRIAADIIGAWEVMKRTGVESVVSHVPDADDPNKLIPNGAVYILTVDAIKRGFDWWGVVTQWYRMPPERSIDIDTQADLDRAREMYAQQNA